jgi:acetoin:2,6-dichlorophenolindophenol oxidoreductase subunit alpha
VHIADADLEQLIFIRRFEQMLLKMFADGKLSGTTHTCIGQEYIPVALAPLTRRDFVFSNHRGHGHYLAHCDDPEGLLAEIMGREGAPCRGVGGSQHLRGDAFLSTGVQGETMAVAVGVAMHFKRTAQRRLALVYIGDGTWGEGSVYEALNMAQLWQVPLLVIVENNGIAQSTPTEMQLSGSIEGRAAAFGVGYQLVETADVQEIRESLASRIEAIRSERTPFIAEFHTIRLGPHSKGDDTRDTADVTALRARDWWERYRLLMPEKFEVIDKQQRSRVQNIVTLVSQLALSGWEPYDAT